MNAASDESKRWQKESKGAREQHGGSQPPSQPPRPAPSPLARDPIVPEQRNTIVKPTIRLLAQVLALSAKVHGDEGGDLLRFPLLKLLTPPLLLLVD